MIAAELPSVVHLTAGPAPTLAPPSQPLLVNMHNAGDTAATARLAASAHPSMIEVDVSWNGSDLVVDHTLLPRPFTQHATELDDAWRRTTTAPDGFIDAKMRSDAGVDALIAFARAHRDRPLYVSTPDAAVLTQLHEGAPWVHTLLSVCTPTQLAKVLQGRAEVPGLYGYSANAKLLSRTVDTRLSAHHRFVLAYSVDDMARIRTLAAQGVRGITTDNCSIAEALTRHSVVGRL